jgi:hypothetical protein
MLPVAALIGALAYRLRGGWLKDLVAPFKIGTQASRLVWAVPTACLMTEMAHAPWYLAIALSITNFTALALFGTGQYLDNLNLRVKFDWLGLARNSLASVLLVLYSPVMFAAYALSGAAHALMYWLGHRTGYDSRAGECIVGAVSWSVIVLCR